MADLIFCPLVPKKSRRVKSAHQKKVNRFSCSDTLLFLVTPFSEKTVAFALKSKCDLAAARGQIS